MKIVRQMQGDKLAISRSLHIGTKPHRMHAVEYLFRQLASKRPYHDAILSHADKESSPRCPALSIARVLAPQRPFPPRDDGAGDGVADDVGG